MGENVLVLPDAGGGRVVGGLSVEQCFAGGLPLDVADLMGVLPGRIGFPEPPARLVVVQIGDSVAVEGGAVVLRHRRGVTEEDAAGPPLHQQPVGGGHLAGAVVERFRERDADVAGDLNPPHVMARHAAVFRDRHEAAVVVGVLEETEGVLLDVVQAFRTSGPLPRRVQGGQQQRGEDGDDRDDDQEFDQGEFSVDFSVSVHDLFLRVSGIVEGLPGRFSGSPAGWE